MKKYIFILFYFVFIFLNSSTYYKIINNNKISGYCEIDIRSDSIIERYLWLDGFSKEYIIAKHSFYNYYNYKSVSYYMNNKNPKKIIFESNELYRENGLYSTTIQFNENYQFVYNPFAPLSALIYSNKKIIPNNKFINVLTGEKFFTGKGISLSDTSFYPDTIHFFNYSFIKTKKTLFSNPYKNTNFRIYDTEKYLIKKHHKSVQINGIIGELSFDKLGNTIIIILPFDFKSDMYGNTINSHSYCALQLAEQIKYPVFIFDFNNYIDFESKQIIKAIHEIYKYYRKRFNNVIFISFNQMLPLFIECDINAHIIAFNPPVIDYKEYKELMFSKLSKKHNYIYSNLMAYINYDPFYNLFTKKDFIKEYSGKSNIHIVFSRSVLSKDELLNARKIDNKITFINNIDRRLNSYIVNQDTWSFEKYPLIHKNIMNYINKKISNYRKEKI